MGTGPATTRSSTGPGILRGSTPRGIAATAGWRGTPQPASGGRRRTGRTAGEENKMLRPALLTALKKRIRDVRQGPDGLLYVLAEDDATGDTGEGALLRLEPAK